MRRHLLASNSLHASAIVILALASPAATFAQTAATDSVTLARYDINKNGRLDPDELAAMQTAEAKVEKIISPESSGKPDSDVVELSPFQVKGGSNGYYAKNTTASTRLNTSLDDLASSTSIVTKEQMEDFAMLDINDIFKYEVSTEGTATFTDAAVDRNGSPVDNTSNNPAAANRVRGIGQANIARGNFASNGRVPIDPIDIDAVEISRGPNSSIFGLGEVSGTVNLQPASANTGRNKSTVAFRVDSYDGYRSSIDLNRVLLKDKLAVRGSAVYQHDAFERKPSGVDTVRLNGMIKYTPFKWTTLTGSFSTYRSDGTLVNQTQPKETITSWQAAGSPTWDPVTQTIKINGAVVPGAWSPTNLPAYFNASQSLGLSTVFVQPDGNISWWGPSRTTSVATSPITPNQNVFLVSTAFTPLNPAQPLYPTDPATSDKSIYDYTSVNLAAMNHTEVDQSTAIMQLEQTFLSTPRQLLAFQGGYFRENGVRKTADMWGTGGSGGRTGYIYVDANERMVDGTANPNFLRPYLGTYNIRERADSYSRRNTGRGQLAYRLDLRNEKNWTKWLGMNTLSAYAEYRESSSRIDRWQDEITNSQTWRPYPAAEGALANWTTTPVAAQPFYRYYLGDATGQNIDYAPHAVNHGTYDFTWGNGVTGVFHHDPAEIDYNYIPSTTTGWTKNILKTQGAALQSYLLKDRVVTTLGFRKDHTWDRSPANFAQGGRTYYFGPDGYRLDEASLDVLSPADSIEKSGNTKTAGVVVKVAPWLRLYYNQSDSFLPVTLAQVGLFRNLLPNPAGKGKDYGIQSTLFHGKLDLRLNYFNTLQVQARDNNGGTLAQRVQGVDLTTNYVPPGLVNLARGWITRAATAAGTTLTLEEIDTKIEDIVKLPRDYWEDQISNSLVYAPSDITSKGYELEVNYNPTRYWTVKFNASQTESIDSNLSKDINDWLAMRMPVWTSIIDPELHVPFYTERYGAAMSAKEFIDIQLANIAVSQANEGKSRPQVRKYKFNVLTRYQLAGISDNKWLKAVSVGAGMRWEDKGAIGYYGVPDANGVYTSLDPNRPIYDEAHAYFDVFATYRTRFYHDKVGATFQLNIRNIQENGRLQPISALPDGTPSGYRIVDPRQFILSVSFDL